MLLVALVAGVLSATTSGGGGVSGVRQNGIGYTLTNYRNHHHGQQGLPYTISGYGHHHVQQMLHYTISGNLTRPLYPGGYSRIDFSFSNPNSQSITVPAGAIAITITSRKGCPAYPNFKVVHTLTKTVTIPKHARNESLSNLRINPKDWPVIEMVTTPFTQDACLGTFYLHYQAGGGSG